MRYENPLYMAEEAAAADLISGGRLQLGVSRGSPEPALRGSEAFGYLPAEGQTDADSARQRPRSSARRSPAPGSRRPTPAMTGSAGHAADPAAVARSRRPDLVGLRHARARPSGPPSRG